MVHLSAIIVSWNTRELLGRCLHSLLATVPQTNQLEVIVVDNASIDSSQEMVRSHFPGVLLLANSHNVGFAAANNQAMQRASGDYLLLLNPDTEIVGTAVLDMVRYIELHPEVAVVGPKLLNSDGSVQSSRRRFPTKRTAFLESTVFQRWMPNHPDLRSYYVLDRSDEEIQEVDWLVGACLLVRATAAKQVGLMDEGYFMYSEELDWCRRFSAAGWKVVYLPTARVVHFGGQSSDQDLFNRHTRFQFSKCRYFEKYHGRSFAQMLRLFLVFNYLYLLIEDLVKLAILRRNRIMRRKRIITLWHVIVWLAKWAACGGRVNP